MEKDIVAIIMAGGLGTRMNSDIPKVLHKIYKIPMIVHILIKLEEFRNIRNLKQILIVVGKYKEQIKNNGRKPVNFRLHEKTNLFLVEFLGYQHQPDHVNGKEHR